MNVFGLTPGETYYVQLAAKTSATMGKYKLRVLPTTAPEPPANNWCATADSIGIGASPFNLSDATMDCPMEPLLARLKNDVWNEFSALDGGLYEITTCPATGAGPSTTLAVYSGEGECPVDSERRLAANDDAGGDCGGGSRVYIWTEPLEVYLIRIGGENGSEPNGTLTIIEHEDEDCNGNGVPDANDIAGPTSQDCQPNGVPDECDIAGMTSHDDNDNGVPDECERRRPMPEDCATIAPGDRCSVSGTCVTDGDCDSESDCIPPPTAQPGFGAVCYAPKSRYLSIAVNPGHTGNTARRLKLDNGAELGWVGEPFYVDPTSQHDGLWLADVVPSPHYEEQWPGVVHVTGCRIGHASLCDVSGTHCAPNSCPGEETCVQHAYHIQALPHGFDPADESNYSEVLELRTNSTWGDTVSTCAGSTCKPPNGIVGLDDVQAAIKYYQNNRVAPITWLDIDPSNGSGSPDQNIGIGDILKVIDGFQAKPYPGDGPNGCW
jgi:hypothetical protein